ncbi:MAG: deoxyribodipyrimidine photo-lyase [Fusobacteriaceae bacterium]
MLDKRVKYLNELDVNNKGEYVLYWMQQSCRVSYNHALNYAVQRANELDLPLLVCFGITDSYPEANERHYSFLLEGLLEVKEVLEKIQINFVLKKGMPWKVALDLSEKAAVTVVDMGYLKIQKEWRNLLKKEIGVSLIQVESDLIVPVEVASSSETERAYLMGERIQKYIHEYSVKLAIPKINNKTKLNIFGEDFSRIQDFLNTLSIDKSVKKSIYFTGGYSEAKRLLKEFISEKLIHYNDMRNIPTEDKTSKLSAYLHFGQISSLEIILEIESLGYNPSVIKSFYNELVVWRQLCYNFCYYNELYDCYKGINLSWVYENLNNHLKDKRKYVYSLQELETGKTHDSLWNAAQMEMVKTGRMHGYMRIYWGKKIIEWSLDPAEAFKNAVYLNDKYELDGRDPNGYGGIAWCFGKHDRPVQEKPILGTIRSSSVEWLRKSFDIEKYISSVNGLNDI